LSGKLRAFGNLAAGQTGDMSLIAAILLTSVKSPLESKLPPVSTPVHLNAKFHAPCCLDGWVGYRGKCYYFSEAEGTWDSSQSFCSSLNASLAWIDTEKDLDWKGP
uniref:C-type lectin domain-containing protein n=1 Tax=Terrapene triunguis TaxID=2587831 RepID=A0A674J392_9SAUR